MALAERLNARRINALAQRAVLAVFTRTRRKVPTSGRKQKTPLQRACITAAMLMLGYAGVNYGDLHRLFEAQRKRHWRGAWRYFWAKNNGEAVK